MDRQKVLGLLALLGFVACVVLANWLVDVLGVIPVGLGLHAPAGVLVVGASFILRDYVQDYLSPGVIPFAIIAGAWVSVFVASPDLGQASLVAFMLSETTDFLIYSSLWGISWGIAVIASSAGAIAIDSMVFLSLAESLGLNRHDYLWGQMWGKSIATLLAVAVMVMVLGRRAWAPR